ncbi:hypothetical protein [Microbacterium sp. 2FI]|uniref:hypothetical protein n=1 Tax=Microbacterium sp. 2FI TaxID=2502193 RepID=UPI0010F688F7|nr:hypothetical protein [Microbacterium sp. 2FI]
MATTDTAVQTGYATLIVEKKLPDDLTLVEFSELVSAVETLCFIAARIAGPPQATRLVRVRYGSDALMVVAVATAIAGILLSLGKTVHSIASAARESAGADREREEAERARAEARKLNAEAVLLELDAEGRIEELANRLGSRQNKALVGEELIETGVFDNHPELERAARSIGVRTIGRRPENLARAQTPASERNAENAADVRELVRSILILSGYEVEIRVESD